ncbi:MAG: DoxX family protein [Marinoscillum sp.]
MKNTRIIFWVSTTIIFLFEGVMPGLTSHTELAKQGVQHLGYPDYFRVLIAVFKVSGALVLMITAFPARLKEWAYAGFGITFICACVSHWVVDGFGLQTMFPLIILGILVLSYTSYHKLHPRAIQWS